MTHQSCHRWSRCVYLSLLQLQSFRQWGNISSSLGSSAPVEYKQHKCRCVETNCVCCVLHEGSSWKSHIKGLLTCVPASLVDLLSSVLAQIWQTVVLEAFIKQDSCCCVALMLCICYSVKEKLIKFYLQSGLGKYWYKCEKTCSLLNFFWLHRQLLKICNFSSLKWCHLPQVMSLEAFGSRDYEWN